MTGSGGLIIAAPASGSGKTTVTLGLLRALRRAGHEIRSAKSGPDYIDPAFHAAASGSACVNLDAWAMTPERIKTLAAGPTDLIVEGAMGLFDGAPPVGKGSAADLAKVLGLPVVLVVNAASMSHSVAALVHGFSNYDPALTIGGVILNNVGSDRHADMLRAALKPSGIPVIGAIPRSVSLARPSRHLGLVQAGETPDLEGFINTAADIVERHVDLTQLRAMLARIKTYDGTFKPPHIKAKTMAIARDAAFSFVYPHQIADWEASGVGLKWFSPLANDPVPDADSIFLPGGYPELHAATISQNSTFMNSLRKASQYSDIYGECGGYMTLGETLIDAGGTAHPMVGLLGLTTSFAQRKLHLGYRTLNGLSPLKPGKYLAHEFHYATTLSADGKPLFNAKDAQGHDLGAMGLVEGRVAGSFAHIIDMN